MAVRLVVAVTDNDWYETLRRPPNRAEVNFWAPSAGNFRALEPGELFLFKLHSPFNAIVGGGVFFRAFILPCSRAWETFADANGVNSAHGMRERIAKYRSEKRDGNDFDIGCRILTQPFFFDEANWIPTPASWSSNIVSFKTYDTTGADGRRLWEAVSDRLGRQADFELGEERAKFAEPRLIRPRLGQGAFRELVTDIYARRCAVTRERTLPALEAAHIRPYADGGRHEAHNGLLLRRDIHSLFDHGYVTVTPEMRFEVSGRIREKFENGRDYYALHGKGVAVPERSVEQPAKHALEWHNDRVFLG